jgi:hypothetical protein
MRLTFSAERPEAVLALQEARSELSSMVTAQGYTLMQCDIENRLPLSRWAEFGAQSNSSRRDFGDSSKDRQDSSPNEAEAHQHRMLNLGYNTLDLVA